METKEVTARQEILFVSATFTEGFLMFQWLMQIMSLFKSRTVTKASIFVVVFVLRSCGMCVHIIYLLRLDEAEVLFNVFVA